MTRPAIEGTTVFYIALTRVRRPATEKGTKAEKGAVRMHYNRYLYEDPKEATKRLKKSGGGIVLLLDLAAMLVKPFGMNAQEEYEFLEEYLVALGEETKAAAARAAAGETPPPPKYERRKRITVGERRTNKKVAALGKKTKHGLGDLIAPFLAGMAGAAIGNMLTKPPADPPPGSEPPKDPRLGIAPGFPFTFTNDDTKK